jgi:hypothetical protein
MPDAWERNRRFDPRYAADVLKDWAPDPFTKLEKYRNERARKCESRQRNSRPYMEMAPRAARATPTKDALQTVVVRGNALKEGFVFHVCRTIRGLDGKLRCLYLPPPPYVPFTTKHESPPLRDLVQAGMYDSLAGVPEDTTDLLADLLDLSRETPL